MRLIALRGATTVDANEADHDPARHRAADARAARAQPARRGPIVSCIFTLTPDLDAEFPAVAARHMGLSRVPLLCAREIPVPGALPRVIRVPIHCYPPVGVDPQHVYLGDARGLRLDLEGAQ